jgi:hypothetical protein
MGKPYSDLEKRAIAILANGGNPASSQDTALARYWQWRINPSSNDHKLPAASKRPNNRKKDEVALLPFAMNPVTGIFAQGMISKRAKTALGSNATVCGHQTTTTSDKVIYMGKYKPAYVYWRTGDAATSADRTSRITGRSYKSYYAAADEGYMVPFGRLNNTSTEGEAARQKAIKTALGASINLYQSEMKLSKIEGE